MRLSTKTYQDRKNELMWILDADNENLSENIKKDLIGFIDWGASNISRYTVNNNLFDTRYKVVMLCEYLWSYRNNIHIIGSSVVDEVGVESVDTESSLKYSNGIDSDVTINNVETYIHVRECAHEVKVCNVCKCGHVCEVFTADGDYIRFYFISSSRVDNVYIYLCGRDEPSDCSSCNKNGKLGGRYKVQCCSTNELYGTGEDCNWDPLIYLNVAMNLLSLVTDQRETVQEYGNKLCGIESIMVVQINADDYSESVIPLYEYVCLDKSSNEK